MSGEQWAIGRLRGGDVWGLAFSSIRRQKVRAALTLIGVVVGTFTLALSLAVGQGVDRAVVALFHKDDRLRKISVHPKWEPNARDVPAADREPVGPMGEAKRRRLRKALVRNYRGSATGPSRRDLLDGEALERFAAIEHVERVEPLPRISGQAILGDHRHESDIGPVLVGSRFFAGRMLAGRLLAPEDDRAAMVHEYLLYRWGMVGDSAAADAIGKTFRVEYRSSPPGTVDLAWIFDRGMPGSDQRRALESGLRRLAAIARFLPLPRDEREALRRAFDRISVTSTKGSVEVFSETFTIVGVVRESDKKDTVPSPFGEWPIMDSEVLIPAHTAADMYLRSPEGKQVGFYEAILTVDDEGQVKAVADRVEAMGFQQFSLAMFLGTIRMNIRLITLAMAAVAVVALLVAAIGITNTMIMSVLERTHEIGVMKAVGARDQDIRRIFVVEGTTLGVFGSSLGMALAWLAGYPGDVIARRIMEPEMRTAVEGALIVYPAWIVVGVPVLVCLITTMAAWYPAARAARVDPVTSLRHE